MRDTYGHWYVYFTYGMHWCANVTTNKGGAGAVLIRAVEPTEGIALMRRRRGIDALFNLCSGPAKFCQAFGITGKENMAPAAGRFAIYDAPELPESDIGSSSRIGIKNGTDLPWRFYIKGSPFVTRDRMTPDRKEGRDGHATRKGTRGASREMAKGDPRRA